MTEASNDPMGSSLQSPKLRQGDRVLVPFIKGAQPWVKHLPFLRELPFWREILGEDSYESPQQPTLVNVQSVPHRSHMYWPGFSNMAVPWFSSYVNLGESFRPLRLSHRILKVQWGLLLSKLPGIQVMLINVAIISSWSSMKIINWALCLELCTHISDHWLTSYSWLCHGFFKLHSRILNSLSTPSSGYGLRERG